MRPSCVGVEGKIGLGEEGAGDGQSGLIIARALLGFAANALEVGAEAEEALRGDGGGAAVDRFVFVEGLGRPVEIIAEVGEAGRAGVPVGDAVDGRVLEVKIGDGFGDAEEAGEDLFLSAVRGRVPPRAAFRGTRVPPGSRRGSRRGRGSRWRRGSSPAGCWGSGRRRR
jgi:hypothetical protein